MSHKSLQQEIDDLKALAKDALNNEHWDFARFLRESAEYWEEVVLENSAVAENPEPPTHITIEREWADCPWPRKGDDR